MRSTKQSHQKTSDPLLSPPIPQGEVTIAKLPSQPAAYTLTVRADPPDSRIRVMNIRPSYKPEMSLPPGEYDILPTEAEWEYATRSGSRTAYGFGDSSHPLNQYAWYGENAEGQPHPVGQLKSNNWGLYDLHGNVWEWLQDWYGATYYQDSPHRNPQGPSSGSHRVVRGGSWSSGASSRQAASRGHWPPDFRSDYVGFRLLQAAQ